MKKTLVAWLFLVTGIAVKAQNGISASGTTVPIKKGTVLEYDVNSNGQLVPLTMKMYLPDEGGIGFEYSVSDNSGKFINSKESLEKGMKTNWDQPTPGEERKVAPDETIAIFSRAFMKELKKNKKAQYDGVDWVMKDVPKGTECTLENKSVVDVVYIECTSTNMKYWVLNNDDYPLMIKSDGNQRGPDLILRNVH